jgi:hypothetical protein
MMNERKFKGDVRDFQGKSLSRKKIYIMNERKKERKKETKE